MPTRRTTAVLVIMAVLSVAAMLAVSGCGQPTDQRTETIGFLGGLSGRSSSLGLEGRDGAQLAIELANDSAASGVRFTLREADDAVDSAAALRTLADSGAIAVVGPMTSSSAVVAVPVANELSVTLLSPAVSTDDLSGIDDQFLRVYPANESAAQELAQRVVEMFGSPNVAAIYDYGNRAHTETWLNHFRRSLTDLGGSLSVETTFISGQNPDYSAIAATTVNAQSDCVFILANAIDSAMLCQRIRAAGSDVHIIATEWSSTDDLIENGGRAVDGMLFLQTYDRHSTGADYVEFVEAFQNRYGYTPGFAGLHAYDATRMVIDAVSRGATRETMKETLLTGGAFAGTQASITLDQYGDVEPTYFVTTVQNGAFVRAESK